MREESTILATGIITLLFLLLIFTIPTSAGAGYLNEDWIFTPPLDTSITPPLENQTPAGVWKYNLTIPMINGTNQFWVWLIQGNNVIEFFDDMGQYYTGPYDIIINTTLFVTGWVFIRVYAYLYPAYLHGSFWELDRWVYIQ
jgi:hypothetical protein